MKFPYRGHVGIDPISGEAQYVTRPEIPLLIHGPTGSQPCLGWIDTGADYTLVPAKIATLLGVDLSPTQGAEAEAFGGHRVKTTWGEIVFEIEQDGEVLRWPATVLFHESENETILLGHVGFLHYFLATFNSDTMEVSLMPTADFPHLP